MIAVYWHWLAWGVGWFVFHMWNPLLRSAVMFGLVSRSFSIARSYFVFLSPILQALGCGHCSICPVVSILWLHLGQPANSCCPHCCIICPVVQNPVVNLVVHLCCLMVIPGTTICMVGQSMDSISIPQNCDLFDQYSHAAWPHVCSNNWCFAM